MQVGGVMSEPETRPPQTGAFCFIDAMFQLRLSSARQHYKDMLEQEMKTARAKKGR